MWWIIPRDVLEREGVGKAVRFAASEDVASWNRFSRWLDAWDIFEADLGVLA
jgi:hypothetical protein